ncbi:091R [Cherax quadricarinatus iridovirus]|uniref:091R n=1 Tax=Cherax quadricarinatus iridovirus TaxID=2035708 RepID=UPI000BC09A30|nr:091R [Cherax quadricarinatus iridovirus]UPA43405.1 091R [Iridovirus CN01]ASZ85071.1 091R [Cherax quadricarinatus iridovirus]UPA43481.1 091R [Iridovirus CN01]UPA43676.1 091R [Iridovirus CN01]UPA43838.1 091R [Iridovirus CN01]
MQDYTITTVAFTLTNLIHFGVVVGFLTPPMICHLGCLMSMFAGASILPALIICDLIFYSKKRYWIKFIFFLLTLMFSFLMSLSVHFTLLFCYDPNWFIWFVQGTTIPATVWAVYKIVYPE